MNTGRVLRAFLGALLVAGSLTWWLGRRVAHARSTTVVPTRTIMVAGASLRAGEALSASSLRSAQWLASQPLPGSFARPESLVGRILSAPAIAGEPILAQHLAAMGSGTGLTAAIPEGMRAISVRTDIVAGVAGFVLPGSAVDVLVSYPRMGAFTSATVLQDIRVLAVGDRSEPDSDAKAMPAESVTLLVTPQGAETLNEATALGKVQLLLRNGADREIVPGLAAVLSALDAGAVVGPALPAQTAQGNHASRSTAQPARSRSDFAVETIFGGSGRTQAAASEVHP